MRAKKEYRMISVAPHARVSDRMPRANGNGIRATLENGRVNVSSVPSAALGTALRTPHTMKSREATWYGEYSSKGRGEGRRHVGGYRGRGVGVRVGHLDKGGRDGRFNDGHRVNDFKGSEGLDKREGPAVRWPEWRRVGRGEG